MAGTPDLIEESILDPVDRALDSTPKIEVIGINGRPARSNRDPRAGWHQPSRTLPLAKHRGSTSGVRHAL
jgi:hypothetical protein